MNDSTFTEQDPISKTIASYEAKAGEYIKNTESLETFPGLQTMLDSFISLLPGRRILDVAFGSGRDTLYFSQKGLDVEGIELTQAFIDALQLKTSIPLYKMDMRQLKFEDNTFDGIWCCAAFLHIPRTDALTTLQGFARVLKLNGILHLDLKEGFGEKWVTAPDSNVSNAQRYFTYYHFDEICRLLKQAGFEVFATQKRDHIKPNKSFWLNLTCRKS